MGRHRTHVNSLAHGYRSPGWGYGYRCEWAIVVGDRVRRLRRDRGLTLVQLCHKVEKPHGEGSYSAGYFSRLERGWASPPLYAYVMVADVLGVHPGRLLGPDDAQQDVTEAELTLITLIRNLRMPIAEAIARLAGLDAPGAGDAGVRGRRPPPAEDQAAGATSPAGWDSGVAESVRAYVASPGSEPTPK